MPGFPALTRRSRTRHNVLNTPAARLIARGKARPLLLDEVEAVLASKALVVDACRHVVRSGRSTIPLATRPVLFTLIRALAEAWPDDVPRGTLITRAFRAKVADESHRARLRVEMGRLRSQASIRGQRERDGARILAWSPRLRAMSSSWHALSKRNMRRCWHCSPTASPGPARHSRSDSAPVNAPFNARSIRWPGAAGAVLRSRPRASLDDPAAPPDSRPPCYSRSAFQRLR